MSIYVRYKDGEPDVYPDAYSVKTLQSGHIQIRRPVEADVPEMGSEESEMVVKKEITVAAYSSYIKWWRDQ